MREGARVRSFDGLGLETAVDLVALLELGDACSRLGWGGLAADHGTGREGQALAVFVGETLVAFFEKYAGLGAVVVADVAVVAGTEGLFVTHRELGHAFGHGRWRIGETDCGAAIDVEAIAHFVEEAGIAHFEIGA